MEGPYPPFSTPACICGVEIEGVWGPLLFLPPRPPPPHTTIRHTMCHLLCGGFFLSLFPRLPFNYAIIKSGQRDKNKTLRVLFLRKNKGPLCEARRGGGGGGGEKFFFFFLKN